MLFKIWYNCSNGGDGSVSVNFFSSEARANEYEEWQQESGDDGWGESSVGCLEVESPGFTVKSELDPKMVEYDDYNETLIPYKS